MFTYISFAGATFVAHTYFSVKSIDIIMAENFKVVVVGAGPVGLVLLHALSRAGIDFICLERATDPLKDIGASLVLTPASMRVMSQLGIYDDVVAISVKIQQLTTFNAATGGQWDSSGLTEVITREYVHIS